MASRANEVLYGGAAGGGKSAALLAMPLRWIDNPQFRCLYLRREATYLGDAIDKSESIYPQLGARLVRSPRIVWTFPSGATIWFNHCEHEKDTKNYDGFEFQLVLFDELTHFTERQYLGIRARLRSPDRSLPCWSRAASNPGGEGHEWVFKRWGAWLDPKTSEAPATPAELRWYVGDRQSAPDDRDALSRTFIGARLSDNPFIPTEYRAQLAGLDAVRRAQLLEGDWLAKPAAGLLFKREWFEIVDSSNAPGRRCRYWDRAASVDGDWTVGARWLREPDGRFAVEDVIRFRGRPADVEARILKTAEVDGKNVAVVLEQDPGQAGVADVDHYVRALVGYEIRSVRPTGDKITRARPASAQCEHRKVRVVRGSWNSEWFAEHEAFPDGAHDDQVDTTSGAVAWLGGHIPGVTVPRVTRRQDTGRRTPFG